MTKQYFNMVLSRQVVISDQNEGPVVNIAAWLGMTIMILCVCTRLFSKYSVIRRITLDDVLIGVTSVRNSCITLSDEFMLTLQALAVGHTYTLSMMVANGLGRPQQALNNDMIEDFEEVGVAYSEENTTLTPFSVRLCLTTTIHPGTLSCKALNPCLSQSIIPRHSICSPQYRD